MSGRVIRERYSPLKADDAEPLQREDSSDDDDHDSCGDQQAVLHDRPAILCCVMACSLAPGTVRRRPPSLDHDRGGAAVQRQGGNAM